MCATWALIFAANLSMAAGPAPDEEPLKDGWRKVVPIPNPLLGDGDQYVVWVDQGWLQARRETAAGETDWQIVLARASDSKPPTITAPKGTFRFEVSYREGRYFVREDVNILRCLREKKSDDPKTWPSVPFKAEGFQQGTGGPWLGLWSDKDWSFVAARPDKDRIDCLVRIAPSGLDRGTSFEAIHHSSVARIDYGKDWVMDEGDLLIAQRSLAAMVKAELKIGQMAPPFQAKTFDNKPIALGDYRGKYVLLDFWATWCGPCLTEFSHLETVYKEFGKDERFALISLNLDDETDAPKKFLAGRALPWSQVFLGNPLESQVAKDYNAQSIPLTVLIGPDGKIVALGLRGESIKETVVRVLGKP
jgi:thiol-disulfide isomerase/thioredoxin